jgi:hypothetical protein
LGIDPEALRLVVQWSFRCTGTFLGTGKNVRMDGASVTRQQQILHGEFQNVKPYFSSSGLERVRRIRKA